MFQNLFGGKSISFEQPHPYCDLPLLLVSGFARSGTTVLRKAFAAHSLIDSNDRESNIIDRIASLAHRSSENRNHRNSRVVNEATYWSLFRNLVLFLHWPQTTRAPQAISTYSTTTKPSLNGLMQMFPDLFICYIVRNGVEVLSSHLNFWAFKEVEFRKSCRDWQKHSEIATYGQSLDRFMLFRHEWFLDEQQTVQPLTAALEKIGLKFEQSCLDVIAGNSFHPTSMEGEPGGDATALEKRIDRWKYWTDEQRDIFETECSGAMESLGYPIPWK